MAFVKLLLAGLHITVDVVSPAQSSIHRGSVLFYFFITGQQHDVKGCRDVSNTAICAHFPC